MAAPLRSCSLAVFAWSPGFWAKMISMGVLGIGVGMFFMSYGLVVVEILGLPLLTPLLSISGVFMGIFVIIFGPFIGKWYFFHDLLSVGRITAVNA